MLFRPKVNSTVSLNNTTYTFPEHPTAKNMVYGQTGKRATVYQVVDSQQQKFGLKVFKQLYQTPSMVETGKRLAPFSELVGMEVCKREVIQPEKHAALVEQYPDLSYAVLMPWVMGETWFDVLIAKKAFTEQDSRYYAGLFAQMMTQLELNGLAHCDISGPNLMIDFTNRRVAMVDVEELFGPGFTRPAVLPSGTAGYAHQGATAGLWSADADRFPGAILLAEMLAQCDPCFRQECGQSESFFEPAEMQQDCPRYRLLGQILENKWGSQVRGLFEQAWNSPTFSGCPTFSQWLSAIKGEQREQVYSAEAQNARSVYSPPQAPMVYTSTMPATSQPQIGQPAAQTVNKTYDSPPAAPVVSHWREFKASALPVGNEAKPSAAAAIPGSSALYNTAPQAEVAKQRNTPTEAPADAATGVLKQKKYTVNSQVMNVFWLFAAIAVVVGIGIVLLAPSVQALKYSVLSSGYTTFFTSGSTLLALLIGSIQAWVFKYRLKQDKRLKFILITAGGGLAGGLLTGLVTEIVNASTNMIPMNLTAGAIMGGIGGAVASLGQNQFLGNHSAARKWVWYSIISWMIIWSFGWQLSYALPGAAGTALAVGFMLLASGASLAWLLKNTPEIEF